MPLRPISAAAGDRLYSVADTRSLEQKASQTLPPHTLMARAAWSVASLARALWPHARCIWVACGPGNNGGDGLAAAAHLHRWSQSLSGGPRMEVTWLGDPQRLPADAAWAWQMAQAAGVELSDEPPEAFDGVIDALLGIGPLRPPSGRLAEQLRHMASVSASVPILSVDLPSGLDADSGRWSAGTPVPNVQSDQRHTLSLLTLKPGLFTAHGRDLAGSVWLDDLGVQAPDNMTPRALLAGASEREEGSRPHASHKGSFGEVVVVGGQDIAHGGIGMTGAAVLAARAALHQGAGRVYLSLLDDPAAPSPLRFDPVCPELMLRSLAALLQSALPERAQVVCGCGGGDAVAWLLPDLLQRALGLTLDADALNALANDPSLQSSLRDRSARGACTVLTPHPLEAARLLGTRSEQVMADRIGAATELSQRFGAICVLKGSGTVLSAPGQTPRINFSGNAALATAGTGDVLAGMIGARLAASEVGPDGWLDEVSQAVFHHGDMADRWLRGGEPGPLVASRLATLRR